MKIKAFFHVCTIVFFITFANADNVKIDSSFINKTNNHTLFSKYKNVCPVSLQNKNIELQLFFNPNMKAPDSQQISLGVYVDELDEQEYDDDFKIDIENSIKMVLKDICNTTFDQDSKNSTLKIGFEKFESTNAKFYRISRHTIPFVEDVHEFNITQEYKTQCKIGGSLMQENYDYSRSYEAHKHRAMTKKFPAIRGKEFILEDTIKYLDTNATIYTFNLLAFLEVGKKSINLDYTFFDDKQNQILGSSSGEVSFGFKYLTLKFDKLTDYKIARLFNAETLPILTMEFDDINISRSAKKEAEDEDEENSIDGMFSFMLYDVVKSIIENAK